MASKTTANLPPNDPDHNQNISSELFLTNIYVKFAELILMSLVFGVLVLVSKFKVIGVKRRVVLYCYRNR